MGVRAFTQIKEKARSVVIDHRIKKDSRSRKNVNVLLLGNYPEGSTIIKQMKIQHGFTDDELLRYRLTIYRNSLDAAQALIRPIHHKGVGFVDPVNHAIADRILGYHVQHTPSFIFSREVAIAIHHLLQDPIIPKVLDPWNEPWLCKTTGYFCKEILRIGAPDYIPTDSDFLQAQEGLMKAVETRFTFGALQTTIIDVGRQHTLKRWICYFENVTCIIFCVSLSDYDRVLIEDDRRSALSESLPCFESVANSRWFPNASIILLLTNVDIFKSKLPKIPLEKYFPGYAGGADVNEALRYIHMLFRQCDRARRPLYILHHQSTDSTTPWRISEVVKKITIANAQKDLLSSRSYSSAKELLRLWCTFPPVKLRKPHLWGIF